MMQPDDIKQMVESGLPRARVSVTGDGHHFDARLSRFASRGARKSRAAIPGGPLGGKTVQRTVFTVPPRPWRAPLRGALRRVQFCSRQNCEAEVISSKFASKTMLQQHQIVYHTLGGKMGNEIHALSLRTQASAE